MNPLAVHPVLLGVDFLVLVGVYAFCRAGRVAIAVGLIIAKAIGLLVGW